MNFMINLKLKYSRFRERMRTNKDKKWRKYYLDHYGAYHNADQLSRDEMLEVFWKMLKYYGYDVFNFDANTNVHAPGKQLDDWEELEGEGFIIELTQMFDLKRDDIAGNRVMLAKTFGELADLVIKKAKEKKQKQVEKEMAK